MPFKCSLCELDIQVGEPMLADEKMNLAHDSCVKRKQANPGSSVVVLSSPAPPSPLTLTSPDACVPSRPTLLCAECGQSAIAMCPYCGARVHQDYGYAGLNCSGRHEGKCPGARDSREPRRLSREELASPFNKITYVDNFTVVEIRGNGGNGFHKKPSKKKRGR